MSSYEYADRLKETVKNYPIFFLSKSCITNDAGEKYFPPKNNCKNSYRSADRSFSGILRTPRRKQRKFALPHGYQYRKTFRSIGQTNLSRIIIPKNTDHTDSDLKRLQESAEQKAIDFITFLPEMRRILSTDVTAMYNGDPAAQNKAEVILCYPAIRAICNYRIAHKLLELDVPLIPRIITEMAHSETGIDIHPGAVIGEYFAIDHGTGVVIGATSVIGNRVKLYQGVTLGARSFPLDENNNPIKGIARHPIIEDDVIIYSNATILGRITIGKGAVIGGNIWVTENVAPGERLVQAKAKP